ncbi:hypothetical protein JCM5296_002000 [Sporobolomyces johnsonii]
MAQHRPSLNPALSPDESDPNEWHYLTAHHILTRLGVVGFTQWEAGTYLGYTPAGVAEIAAKRTRAISRDDSRLSVQSELLEFLGYYHEGSRSEDLASVFMSLQPLHDPMVWQGLDGVYPPDLLQMKDGYKRTVRTYQMAVVDEMAELRETVKRQRAEANKLDQRTLHSYATFFGLCISDGPTFRDWYSGNLPHERPMSTIVSQLSRFARTGD